MYTFPDDISLFASSDVNGRFKRPVFLNVTEKVKTTRSNRLKFRLYPDKMIQLLELNCLH